VDADAGPVHSGDRGGYLRPQRVEHGCHPGQAGPVRRPGGRRGRRTRRAASGGRGRLLRGQRCMAARSCPLLGTRSDEPSCSPSPAGFSVVPPR
jgi:hypothetical protein